MQPRCMVNTSAEVTICNTNAEAQDVCAYITADSEQVVICMIVDKIVMFPPEKLGREISREIWDFEISRFPGNLRRDPGKFFVH